MAGSPVDGHSALVGGHLYSYLINVAGNGTQRRQELTGPTGLVTPGKQTWDVAVHRQSGGSGQGMQKGGTHATARQKR